MLPDLLVRHLNLVVCGTGAGTRSAQLGQYYAGPGNRFWATLADVGLTPERLTPAEYERLLSFGIGLTDLVKHQSGSDRDLEFTVATAAAFRMKIMSNQPWYLCFNGKRAAQEFFRRRAIGYGVQPTRLGRTVLFVAPSTSRAANGVWDLSVWRDLAACVCRPRDVGRSLLPPG